MIKSSRIKRRKTRQEINLFEEIYSNRELDENTFKLSEGQHIELYEGQNINIFKNKIYHFQLVMLYLEIMMLLLIPLLILPLFLHPFFEFLMIYWKTLFQ